MGAGASTTTKGTSNRSSKYKQSKAVAGDDDGDAFFYDNPFDDCGKGEFFLVGDEGNSLVGSGAALGTADGKKMTVKRLQKMVSEFLIK
jgi:hypothetical protein